MKKTRTGKKYAGFTFIELTVAIFILSLIMLTAVSVFAKVALVRKEYGKTLNDVRSGREAIQIMAKNMRVSSQLNYLNAGDSTAIYFFSSSQARCISYRFYNNSLQMAEASPGGITLADCSGASVNYSNSYVPVTSGMKVTGSFNITPTNETSSPKVIGRGTIDMVIDDNEKMQTTVAFLDYIGILN